MHETSALSNIDHVISVKFIDAYDTVFLDCDSTLSRIEGIDQLAKLHGKEAEIAALTKQAMDGKIKFEAVYGKRLEAIQPTYDDLVAVGHDYIATLVPGVKEFVHDLLRKGKEVHIVSGGYSIPVKMLAEYLGIPTAHVHAVDLHFDANGHYTGFDETNVLARTGGKRTTVQKLANNGKRSVFIGDGSTDVEAKGIVDLFIGFGYVVEREAVKKEADLYITEDFYALALLEMPTIRQ